MKQVTAPANPTRELLRDFRKAQSLTQRDLGIEMGFDPDNAQTRIGHIEAGIRRMIESDMAKFIEVAKARGVTIRVQQLDPSLRVVQGKLYKEVTSGN